MNLSREERDKILAKKLPLIEKLNEQLSKRQLEINADDYNAQINGHARDTEAHNLNKKYDGVRKTKTNSHNLNKPDIENLGKWPRGMVQNRKEDNKQQVKPGNLNMPKHFNRIKNLSDIKFTNREVSLKSKDLPLLDKPIFKARSISMALTPPPSPPRYNFLYDYRFNTTDKNNKSDSKSLISKPHKFKKSVILPPPDAEFNRFIGEKTTNCNDSASKDFIKPRSKTLTQFKDQEDRVLFHKTLDVDDRSETPQPLKRNKRHRRKKRPNLLTTHPDKPPPITPENVTKNETLRSTYLSIQDIENLSIIPGTSPTTSTKKTGDETGKTHGSSYRDDKIRIGFEKLSLSYLTLTPPITTPPDSGKNKLPNGSSSNHRPLTTAASALPSSSTINNYNSQILESPEYAILDRIDPNFGDRCRSDSEDADEKYRAMETILLEQILREDPFQSHENDDASFLLHRKLSTNTYYEEFLKLNGGSYSTGGTRRRKNDRKIDDYHAQRLFEGSGSYDSDSETDTTESFQRRTRNPPFDEISMDESNISLVVNDDTGEHPKLMWDSTADIDSHHFVP